MSRASGRQSKKVVAETPEEKHARLMATEPAYAAAVQRRAAWRGIREAYKAGDRSTPELQAIHAVMTEADDLKARLTAASTIAEFQACADIADVSLYEKADALEWRDDMAGFFLTDTRNWTTEAIKWLQWMEANPALAPHVGELRDGPRGSVYRVGARELSTENLEEARQWALDALAAFVNGAL